MPKVTTVVVGAGHCGLAMSRCLAERSIDHVVLERGEVANSWRTERWDSLRLLTPNWLTRLPGYAYPGADPDGYMTSPEVVDLIGDYAKVVDAPVHTRTTVTSVRPSSDESGFVVQTDQDSWQASAVVLASGACNVAKVPAVHEAVPAGIAQLTTMDYRSPDQLADGGVLVVGASSSGVQIADEVHRSGRPVTLAVGEHVRLPRTYRGRDILWWMESSGLLDEGYLEMPDLVRARNLPSMQLVGSPDRVSVDLNYLTGTGIELIGRLAAIRDGQALFSGSLRNVCALADLKLGRLLDTIDAWAVEAGVNGDCAAVPVPGHRGPRLSPADARPERRLDPHDPVGHRLPPGRVVARGPGAGPEGSDAARRRCRHPAAGLVPHRHAVPAAAQVQPDRRLRARRPGSHRAPRRLPRHTPAVGLATPQ